MAFLSFPYGWPWDSSPPPPESVRTCGLSYFFKQKTAKERWHSLVSRMGDPETPLPLPPSLYGRADSRTLTSEPNFLGLIDYQFFLPMELRWRLSRAEAPLRSNVLWIKLTYLAFLSYRLFCLFYGVWRRFEAFSCRRLYSISSVAARLLVQDSTSKLISHPAVTDFNAIVKLISIWRSCRSV